MASIRILLADDHTLVRAGLRSLLMNIPGVDVVAEAGNGREAVEIAKRLRPDIALLDISMSILNGLDAAEQMLKANLHCKVIILSMYSTDEYVRKALGVGVSGYLIKDAATSELELAIRTVVRGHKYLSPAISTHLVDQYKELIHQRSGNAEPLTSRQREVLQLIAEGHTTKEILAILHVSLKTAESHRAQLMERLDIHDIAGLVRYAIRIGLVSSEG